LHAFRDFVYGLLFVTLPFVLWQGLLVYLLCALIVLEICITIWDFNIEVIERADIGGVANKERGLHLIMAVVYGFFLAHLFPVFQVWADQPTGFGVAEGIPVWMQTVCLCLGCGVLASGVRDFCASRGMRFFQRDLFAAIR
jgi:hypothetical protein